jgi:DNA modification methylase
MIDLRNGDCLELMKDIPDGSVDMVLTDPPYGTTACKWDSIIPLEPMWKELKRIIKPNGAIVLFGQEPFSSSLRMSNIKNYKYDWIWKKNIATLFQHCNRMPLCEYEKICVFYSKQCVYNPQNLIKINKENKRGSMGKNLTKGTKNKYIQTHTNYPRRILEYSKDGNLHSTQKPVLLMEYLIKTYSNENETVLDFTMGSGTTGVACVNTNRNFIGFELDNNYFEIASKRINNTIVK